MADRLEHFQKRERLTSADVSLLSEKLRRLIEEPERRQLSPGLERQPIASDVHLLDKFFALFDEEFRGNRTAIKERLKPYLELLQGLDQARVVDIGSGRGEWLELLQEHGFQATGVDLNGVLVKACRERGLDVVEEDLFRYLSAQQDGSLGVLSAFHVVEHLSIEELVSFLNEAMRVLKPGGALMLETPNPQNVLVGSCNFYFDPTHRNPLPSEVLQLLVETRGFEAIKVLPLNPSEAEPVAGDSEIVSRFNQYFYGPMDYGLIAYRP
jgi:O-antigen chain-terminating methyltransferase